MARIKWGTIALSLIVLCALVAYSTSTVSALLPIAPSSSAKTGLRVRLAAAQTINSAQETLISWDTEDRDENNSWSVGAPTQWLVTIADWYGGCVFVDWNSATLGANYMAIKVNGTTVFNLERQGTNGEFETMCFRDYFNLNDIVTVSLYQASGSSKTVTALGTMSR